VDIDTLVLETVKGLGNGVGNSRSEGEFRTSFILVIDALDEVPIELQKEKLDFLNRLVVINNRSQAIRVRIILFSRDDPRIQSHCRSELGWQKTSIPVNAVSRDIETAVIKRLAVDSKADREQLAKRIVEKAAGMSVHHHIVM
jgi:hypothetical protein